MSLYKSINFTNLFNKNCLPYWTNQLKYPCSRSFSKDEKNSESPLKQLLDDAASFEDAKPDSPEDVWATLPYPEGTHIKRDQGAKALRPTIDPKETTIICFPGQGNQFVGMGKELLKYPIVKDMFEMANDVLGYNIQKICLKGPQSELNKTIHCQPATLITSLGALERLKEERPNAIENCVATAGYSLGEITALVFAGAIPFDKALKLVQIRAQAMQMASEMAEGGMATVLYGPDSKLSYACLKAVEHCKEKGLEMVDCRVASYLYPHCKVVAGNKEALDYLRENAAEFKLRRIMPLQVGGAFHSELMAPAVEPFRKALHKIEIEDPIIPVYSNLDGKHYKNAQHIKRQLPKQITHPVKWEQTLHILYERAVGMSFPRTFECGPGSSLTTILKQVNAKAWDSSMSIRA